MNKIENNLIELIKASLNEKYGLKVDDSLVMIEIPKDKANGDYSTNVAMRLAKELKKAPVVIANELKEVLEKVMLFTEIASEGDLHLFEVGEGGNGAQVIVEHNTVLPQGRQGFGTVHHAAFRVHDTAVLYEWIERLQNFGFGTSGYVNRFFFESLYARLVPGILFEWATDGPGFMGDEPYETVGEILSLPPFLEPKREQIEKLVRPIDTVRSTIEFQKEYE